MYRVIIKFKENRKTPAGKMLEANTLDYRRSTLWMVAEDILKLEEDIEKIEVNLL